MRKIIAVFSFLALSSCASGPSGVRPLPPLALATMPFAWSATTAMPGTLLYERGCLLFHDENGGNVYLPVWPTGSTFNGEAVVMHTPGKADQTIQIAEEIFLSGRPLTAPLPANLAPFERQCSAESIAVTAVRPAD